MTRRNMRGRVTVVSGGVPNFVKATPRIYIDKCISRRYKCSTRVPSFSVDVNESNDQVFLSLYKIKTD
jgi:hypothetical protein